MLPDGVRRLIPRAAHRREPAQEKPRVQYTELENKTIDELRTLAGELEVADFADLNRQELIFKLMQVSVSRNGRAGRNGREGSRENGETSVVREVRGGRNGRVAREPRTAVVTPVREVPEEVEDRSDGGDREEVDGDRELARESFRE